MWSTIKELQAKTGASLFNCKMAYEAAVGDPAIAESLLYMPPTTLSLLAHIRKLELRIDELELKLAKE